MSQSRASYNRILKSTSIIGGASFANVMIGVIRTKILAVLLGPAGIGLVGLLTGLLNTASTFITCGVGPVGTRQIADAYSTGDLYRMQVIRRAMLWVTLCFSAISAVLIWSFRRSIAIYALGSDRFADAAGLLAIGVALSIAATSQTALIQGMRRIGDVARLNIFSALGSTLIGIAVLWKWRSQGLVPFVLAVPLISFLLGLYFVKRIPSVQAQAASWQDLRRELHLILRLAVVMVGAGLVQSITQLWLRVDISHVLGQNALGQYQAAWTISMQYVGFVLTAMSADYYPRLTGVISDPIASCLLVNEQTEIALLLSGPVFLAMLAFSPLVIHLLYASSFAPAAEILRWQVLGDVLKIASWPLGFLILAAGDGLTFFWTELFSWSSVTLFVAVGVLLIGLPATGISYVVMYALYLPLVYYLAHRRIRFRWSGEVKKLFWGILSICVITSFVVRFPPWGSYVGSGLALATGLYSAKSLASKSNVTGSLEKMIKLANYFPFRRKNSNAV